MNMDQMPQSNSTNHPLSQAIAHLDPRDPEDATIITNLNSIKEEIRKEFPTPMSVVDTYRKGFIDYGSISSGFNDEEIAEILAECERRNQKEKESSSLK